MSTSKPIEPTALVYDGCSAEQFLAFDRRVKRWLRRKFKGLTKYFWDGEAPTVTEENFKEICGRAIVNQSGRLGQRTC